MLTLIADAADESPPHFMLAPLTDDELLAGIKQELNQLEHFG